MIRFNECETNENILFVKRSFVSLNSNYAIRVMKTIFISVVNHHRNSLFI